MGHLWKLTCKILAVQNLIHLDKNWKKKLMFTKIWDSRLYPRNLKGGIGSLFDPSVNRYGAAAILSIMYWGELLCLRIWLDLLAWSVHIVFTVWFTVCLTIMCGWFNFMRERQLMLDKITWGLSYEKIWRYNNWPQQIGYIISGMICNNTRMMNTMLFLNQHK